jgi:SAM-dependent methyltransferase
MRMKLDDKQVAQLEEFLAGIKAETYPEPRTEGHDWVTARMLQELEKQHPLPMGARVLDVGCGQGVALKHFAASGYDAVGIALNSEDVEAGVKEGFKVVEMDQSFLDFPEGDFDLIWCRHCLEHSVFPYFTLRGFFRVLKPGGWAYVEVPAPDTICSHERNQNHYSVMGRAMFGELMKRAGFEIVSAGNFDTTTPKGPDTYFVFFLQKP